tara:strand:+ start:103 stop:453 length:351 start_codon:yes stop_codon:yes gene_type:complete
MADSKVTNKLRTKESSEVKFSDDELQSLAGLQTSYQEKSAVLGQLKVQRILADQQMEALEDAEDSAVEDYKAVQQEERDLVQRLNIKYGPGQLDPQTGVFTPAPEEESVPESEASA